VAPLKWAGSQAGAMNVALISDTHIPSRASELPAPHHERVAAADHVIHAGDLAGEPGLAVLSEVATDYTAVSGNMDPHDLGLPGVATVDVEDVRFVVTHGHRLRGGYERALAGTVEEHAPEGPAIGVAGHTHEVLDVHSYDHRLLNPGSVTAAAPATAATMMTVAVDGADYEVTLHEV
jgi:putative phosphoesterase